MAGGNPKSLDWKQRLVLEMRRDKKKATVLVVLGLVGLIFFGRMILKSVGPAKAKGASAAAPVSPPAPPSLFYVTGKKKDSPNRPAWRSHRPKDGSITRDLFVADLKYYRKVEPDPEDKPKEQRPDSRAKTEDPETIIRAKAKALTLQSTMVGPNSSAMINGQVLRVGEWIDGFRVVEIQARSCIVEREGVRVQLDMKN